MSSSTHCLSHIYTEAQANTNARVFNKGTGGICTRVLDLPELALRRPAKQLKLICPETVFLRIRPKPSTELPEIASLDNGTVVEVFDEEINGFFVLVDGRVSLLFTGGRARGITVHGMANRVVTNPVLCIHNTNRIYGCPLLLHSLLRCFLIPQGYLMKNASRSRLEPQPAPPGAELVQPVATAVSPIPATSAVGTATEAVRLSTRHRHSLAPVTGRRSQTARCDTCRTKGTCVYFCSPCDWDICQSCLDGETTASTAPTSTRHPHVLGPVPSSRQRLASCDVCHLSGSCAWFCATCDWDICQSCLDGEAGAAGSAAAANHTGEMQCQCGHASGREGFPIDSSRYHLNGACKWLCCQADWSEAVCRVAVAARPAQTTAMVTAKAGGAGGAVAGSRAIAGYSFPGSIPTEKLPPRALVSSAFGCLVGLLGDKSCGLKFDPTAQVSKVALMSLGVDGVSHLLRSLRMSESVIASFRAANITGDLLALLESLDELVEEHVRMSPSEFDRLTDALARYKTQGVVTDRISMSGAREKVGRCQKCGEIVSREIDKIEAHLLGCSGVSADERVTAALPPAFIAALSAGSASSSMECLGDSSSGAAASSTSAGTASAVTGVVGGAVSASVSSSGGSLAGSADPFQQLQKDLSMSPAVLRSHPQDALIEVLKTDNAAKLYQLLCEIFSAWPRQLPIVPLYADDEETFADMHTTYAHVYLLLMVAGLDDSDLAAPPSPLLQAIRHSARLTFDYKITAEEDEELRVGQSSSALTSSASSPRSRRRSETSVDPSPLGDALLSIGSHMFSQVFSADLDDEKLSALIAVSVPMAVAGTVIPAKDQLPIPLIDANITVSSGKNKSALLEESDSSHWESNGSKPHWIQIAVPAGYVWTELSLRLKDHGNYSPSKLRVKCGEKTVKDQVKILHENWLILSIYLAIIS